MSASVHAIMAGLHRLHESEKSERLSAEFNQYTFRVAKDMDKRQIAKVVEVAFGVRVLRVTTLVVKGKVKAHKYGRSARASWKKAYVTLEAGQSIELQEE